MLLLVALNEREAILSLCKNNNASYSALKPNTGGQAEHQTCEKLERPVQLCSSFPIQVKYTEVSEQSLGERKDKVNLIWLECCHIFKETRTDYQHTASLLVHRRDLFNS